MTAPATTELVIRAIGLPAKKGSKSFKGMRRGVPILVEADAKLPDWTKAVQAAAHNAVIAHDWLITGDACEVSIRFWLPRPKTVTRELPTGRGDGDCDKMIRAVLDALTGIVYVDDSQVTDFGEVHQRYADDRPAGARIRVRSVASQLAVI